MDSGISEELEAQVVRADFAIFSSVFAQTRKRAGAPKA
jgi:hypothetical protein